jgi:hypothetical protein
LDEVVFDFEGDGLTPTKIHVVSYQRNGGEIESLYDYDLIRELFVKEDQYLIGHNITRFDIPNLERLLGIKIKAQLVDTLALSWYLYPDRPKHGIESWGIDIGIAKPEILDWFGLSTAEYTNRCVEDVKITYKIWDQFKTRLAEIYGSQASAFRLIKYLQFKMGCARLQEECKWRLDVEKAQHNLTVLEAYKEEKVEELKKAMPLVPVYRTKARPTRYYKADGSFSKNGLEWIKECEERGCDPDSTISIELLVKEEEPNPSSHAQLKDWLFGLGWSPITFKTNPKGKEVPQLNILDADKKGELCPSVLKLAEKEPAINSLAGLFVLNHRISILKGFLDNVDEDGFLTAEIAGLTNTLRFKHATIVNLPGVNKPYGEYIRPILIAEEGYVLCGSDQASLEDRTKQHYMWQYDSDYVKEMNKPDFDPHLDIAMLGGMMTKEEVDEYREHPTPALKNKRHGAKTTNYSCTYGAYPPKIARTANIPLDEAQKLWDAYWLRNWSIKKIAEDAIVNELKDKSKWLYNPVSTLWYSLRSEKDRFSTLNQGTGAYCFDVWLGYVLAEREQLTAQFHDEGVWMVRVEDKERMTKLLFDAIDKANEFLGLNRRLDITVQFGENYGEIH